MKKYMIMRVGEDIREIGIIEDTPPYSITWKNQSTVQDRELFEKSFSNSIVVRSGANGTVELDDGEEARAFRSIEEEWEPENPNFFREMMIRMRGKGYFLLRPPSMKED